MSVRSAFAAAGVPATVAAQEAPLAEAAMREREITTQRRAQAFLAQVLHESGRLRYFEEIADGSAYEGRHDLGNTQPGDGRRFKGRGPIQLTGRANYRSAGAALGLALEAQPTLASRHEIGWRIAAWFWESRGLNGLADRLAFREITRRINGGYNGLADREELWGIVRRHDCRPGEPAPEGPASWLTPTELRRVRELDAIRGGAKPAHDRREIVLVRVLTEQRKRIWRAAQKSGWGRAHRAKRYRSLLARTR